MIEIKGGEERTDEYKAAEKFQAIALENMPKIVEEENVVLQLLPSLQCYGQKVQDIDLVVLFGHFNGTKVEKQKVKIERRGKNEVGKEFESEEKEIQSFCLTIEIKKHNPEEISFEGNKCYVPYNGKLHNVTLQSEKQRYSFVNYLKKWSGFKYSPWVTNLIWLVNCPQKELPKSSSNIIGSDVSWTDILNIASRVDRKNKDFPSRGHLNNVAEVFTKKIQSTKLERKRVEAISKKKIENERTKYLKYINQQLLIFRGRGGTGKTIRLLQIAYDRYQTYGDRILLLTYNKALVADIKRLLIILNIRDGNEECITIKTIHSFMYELLETFAIYNKDSRDFIQKYEEYKDTFLNQFNEGTFTEKEIQEFLPEGLQWDILLIDESQDWPKNERDILYSIYDYKSIILADGKDQFVRAKTPTNWRAPIINSQSQIVPLRKSLRLKSTLCNLVSDFAEEIEFANWDLEPVHETYGGKIYILTGNPENVALYDRLKSQLVEDQQEPLDTMFIVPPSMTEKKIPQELLNEINEREKAKRWDKFKPNENWKQRGKEIKCELSKCYNISKLSNFFHKNEIKHWDGVDPDQRDSFPTDNDQFRIVQYESCRGLEGWITVNFAIDEFFEYKLKTELAESKNSQNLEMGFDKDFHEKVALGLAKKWMMIPLTRAIDTLYIHINDRESFIGKAFMRLHEKNPENIELIELDSI